MGGTCAAYASPPRTGVDRSVKESDGATRADVHAICRSQPTRGRDNQTVDSEDDAVAKRGRNRGSAWADGDEGGVVGDDDDDDYDDDDDDDDDDDAFIAEREREIEQEREEMRARFTFKDESRRNLKEKWLNSMRRKRRMLLRNENLRFRELYRPPELGVLITVITLVTIVTLIITKSWPFY